MRKRETASQPSEVLGNIDGLDNDGHEAVVDSTEPGSARAMLEMDCAACSQGARRTRSTLKKWRRQRQASDRTR